MEKESLPELIDRLQSIANQLERITLKNNVQQNIYKPDITPVVINGIVQAPITAFEDLIKNSVKPFVQVSARIDKRVELVAEMVEKLFHFERNFLVEASSCARPSLDVLSKFYEIFSKYIEAISEFRESNRQCEYFNHFSAISESIGALSWIAIQPAPAPFVFEMNQSAKFYTNRVLRDYKERGPNHAVWVNLWLKILDELEEFIRLYHTTGLNWDSLKKSAIFDPKKVEDSNKKIVSNNISNEINKGEDIAKNLKKVSDNNKTHKNQSLRTSNIVTDDGSSIKSLSNCKLTNNSTSKPPVFGLEENKWRIEYQNKQHNLLVDKTEMKQTVYIYNCNECTFSVKGKVNTIIIDSCQRVDLLFENVLSTVEFINSNNVQMQVTDRVPTVKIESTNGCQIYLSKSFADTDILSSKSTSMNVLIPNMLDDDYVEYPVPELFKTKINLNRKMITNATENC